MDTVEIQYSEISQLVAQKESWSIKSYDIQIVSCSKGNLDIFYFTNEHTMKAGMQLGSPMLAIRK